MILFDKEDGSQYFMDAAHHGWTVPYALMEGQPSDYVDFYMVGPRGYGEVGGSQVRLVPTF